MWHTALLGYGVEMYQENRTRAESHHAHAERLLYQEPYLDLIWLLSGNHEAINSAQPGLTKFQGETEAAWSSFYICA